MKTPQYTIRNIPKEVDHYLRKRAKLSGRSLNQVVVDELSENAGLGKQGIIESLDWFIGNGGVDEQTLRALEEEDAIQKKLAKKELEDANRY